MLSSPKATAANRREAKTWFMKAYRQADSTAADNLAVMYREDGDFRSAVSWFKKSTALNDESARLQLGIHYYWGIGVRKNYRDAIQLFRETVRAKHIAEIERDDAYCYLAIAHLEGNGVSQSSQAAAKLLKQANRDNDHPAAQLLLRRILGK
jgi:TPR repeat protein